MAKETAGRNPSFFLEQKKEAKKNLFGEEKFKFCGTKATTQKVNYATRHCERRLADGQHAYARSNPVQRLYPP